VGILGHRSVVCLLGGLLFAAVGCGGTSSSVPPVSLDADAGAEGGASADAAVDGSGDAAPAGLCPPYAPATKQEPPGSAPLTFIALPNAVSRGAVCNDGTPAGYFIRRGRAGGTNRWVVHLQGGGACFDPASCLDRCKDLTSVNRGRRFMSSLGWASQIPGEGLESADATENPAFADDNHVMIPYCSSDLWSGDADLGAGAEPAYRYFRGRRILNAVLDDLSDSTKTQAPLLTAATRLVLSGSSAGGGGVLSNADAVVAPAKRAATLAVTDAGWFLDIATFDPALPTVPVSMQSGYALWGGKNDASCAAAHPGEEGRCYLTTSATFVTTPLFVQINQTDPPQLANLGVTPSSMGVNAYVTNFAQQVRLTLAPQHAAFSPRNTKTHGLLLGSDYAALKVAGASLSDALATWTADTSKTTVYIEP
jgi:hypothetical protein